jgi:hypothetical protein
MSHLPELTGKILLYVRSRAYDNETHPLRERAQFRLEIGYALPDSDVMQGHKEFVCNFTTQSEFEAALSEASALPGLELNREETFAERVMGPDGLIPDTVTTRRYWTDFYRDFLNEATK